MILAPTEGIGNGRYGFASKNHNSPPGSSRRDTVSSKARATMNVDDKKVSVSVMNVIELFITFIVLRDVNTLCNLNFFNTDGSRFNLRWIKRGI